LSFTAAQVSVSNVTVIDEPQLQVRCRGLAVRDISMGCSLSGLHLILLAGRYADTLASSSSGAAGGAAAAQDSLQHGERRMWHKASSQRAQATAAAVAARRLTFAALFALQVLTFDAYGVSGHLNHRCVHEGVR
jgi:hypothetical protein